MTTVLEVYVFILAAFTGYMVISRVPPLLHTPLMAATNAISGISLVGSIIMAGAQHGRLATILGFIAVVCATTNIVGGFLIVDRMLRMFQRTEKRAPENDRRQGAERREADSVAQA
jgi:H+-translocating NAD(P) transhydrogenase subunit alpha